MSGTPARLNLRRPTLVVNGVLAVALVAGAFWAYGTLSGPATNQAANASVRSIPVQQGTVTKTVTANGSVASASTATASFVTGGTITAIDVEVGSVVKKGQVLARVDPAAAQRSLAAADANLHAADDALSRAKDAGSDTSAAQDDVEQTQLAVDDAQAAVDGTVLKAPMAGTVTAVNGTVGSSSSGTGSSSSSSSGGGSQGSASQGGVGQGSAAQGGGNSSSSSASPSGFMEIENLRRLQVIADFAEADATKLKEKQAAKVTWNALNGTTAAATVAAIDPSATTTNNVVTYGVTLSLDTAPTGAKVGQTVSVAVTTGRVQNAVYVNSAAVTTVGNRHTVTVLSNGRQETRQVAVGLQGDETTQITSGVQIGERVVLRTTSTTSGTGTGFPGGGGFGTFGGAPGGGTFGGNRGAGGGR